MGAIYLIAAKTYQENLLAFLLALLGMCRNFMIINQ